MAIGSGIGASLGIAKETTAGTIVSPSRWLEFNSETLGQEKVIVQGAGLRGGGLYPRASRRSEVGRNAGGDIVLDLATNGMGLLYEAMMGSSTSAVLTGSAYQQVHTPGSLIGKSLSVQKLVPQLDGTLKPFTYNGCKVLSWTLTFGKDAIATLSLTLDAWDETTATSAGTPSYSTTANVFHFLEASLVLGGTVSTTSGLASLSGGSAVAGISGGSITGTTGIRAGSDNRYINGKTEQVQNAWRGITGNLTADFLSQADLYDVFNSSTGVALKLLFTGNLAPITGATYPQLEVLIPRIFFDGESPKVGGPDVVSLTAPFTGADDGTNATVQIRSVTSDTAL